MKLEGDRFTFDFETIENLNTNPGDLFMLCHPHNPVGTAFTEQELIRLSKWITENNLFICSDEIHCDLILDPDSQHFPIASLTQELAARCITLMAPSKTFNLPGFGCSFAVISDSALRIKFKKALQGIVPDPPAMGFLLAEKAYRFGESWRHELLAYLRKNRDLAYAEISKMPNLRPFCPEATYLLWIDANTLPVDNPHQYFEQHGVGLSDGKDFGAPGFLRLNLGCTYDLLKEALLRMENACKALS
jgi:cystathionine beta-lyase